MLLLDTEALPPAERADAFYAAMMQASVPCAVTHEGDQQAIRARMTLHDFGDANLFTADMSGNRLIRTARHVARESPPVIAVAVQSRGSAWLAQGDERRRVGCGELMLTDLTAPYDFGWTGDGASRAFQIRYEYLGLRVDTVRRAAARLHTSPLYGLVRNHLNQLADDAEKLSADPGGYALGAATTELIRALLVSAAPDDPERASVMAQTTATRILTYLRQHLAEPDLTPARIAHAHHISVRTLYAILAEHGISLEQWLITQRLSRARADLASPFGRQQPIAVVARSWGFTNATHFGRRFKATYGITPGEWQSQQH
jgi:AraC-like DNA-binding protein